MENSSLEYIVSAARTELNIEERRKMGSGYYGFDKESYEERKQREKEEAEQRKADEEELKRRTANGEYWLDVHHEIYDRNSHSMMNSGPNICHP